MKFSENMWLMIILKVTKKTGLNPLFRRKIFRKQGLIGSNSRVTQTEVKNTEVSKKEIDNCNLVRRF